VWVSKAKSGPVPEVSAPLNPLDWGDGHSVRFGSDPTSSAFGGRTFDAGEGSRVTRAHSEYRNPGPSLDNMTNIVTGRPGKVTTMPAEDQAGAIPDPADLPVPAIAVPDTGGAALQNLGHHAGGYWGQPMEDAGGSLRDFGQAGNNVLSQHRRRPPDRRPRRLPERCRGHRQRPGGQRQERRQHGDRLLPVTGRMK
jgi:hypothetical protein